MFDFKPILLIHIIFSSLLYYNIIDSCFIKMNLKLESCLVYFKY